MAKIFYCDGLAGHLGLLRAIVSVGDLHNVLSKDGLKYVGKSFPRMTEAGTVIEVAPDERGPWKAGFHRAAKEPLEFEAHLRALLNPCIVNLP